LLIPPLQIAGAGFIGIADSVGAEHPAQRPGICPAHLLVRQLHVAKACSFPSVQDEIKVSYVSVERLQNGFGLWLDYGLGDVFPRKLMNRVQRIPERQDDHLDFVCDALPKKHRPPVPSDSSKIG
jgi:hypothetical protein